jgi:hypothetical protein
MIKLLPSCGSKSYFASNIHEQYFFPRQKNPIRIYWLSMKTLCHDCEAQALCKLRLKLAKINLDIVLQVLQTSRAKLSAKPWKPSFGLDNITSFMPDFKFSGAN